MHKPVYLLLLLLGFLFRKADAQNLYSFQKLSGTYTELSGAKRISFALLDTLQGFYPVTELAGETFTWYGLPYSMDSGHVLYIQPYANLRMDNDSSLIIADAAFTYLDSIDANSSVSYRIEGGPYNRIVKVQWKNLKVRVGQAMNFMNVQLWLYQRSGVIECRYGPSSTNNRTGFNSSTGPQVGLFHSRLDFSKCFGKLWVFAAPANSKLDSNANYTFNAMTGLSDEGTVYRFTPRFNVAGIHTMERSSHITFNNPVHDLLKLSRAGAYRLLDLQGKVVVEFNGDALDMSGMNTGMYLLNTGNKYFRVIKTL